jgi:8-amino-7-oxononanoate synthase
MAINAQLRHLGFMVGAIRPPTVPKGSGRLRICFSAMHSDEQIDQLLEVLESVVAQ